MKRLILLLAAIIAIVSADAETVSQKQAQELARAFFNEAEGMVTAPPKLVYNGRRLTTDRLFTPFYVYNTMKGGFVIIAADNKAFPILGFSLKDSFDPDRLGETELALLRSYAREIEMVRYTTGAIDATVVAWVNYPLYVKNILSARYEATDPKLTVSEALTMVYQAEERDDAVYSDIYTPAQWQEMINDDLKAKESVPILIAEGERDFPAVIYGRQGDYYRISMTRRNSWLMRLNATEEISGMMVTTVENPLDIPFDFAEEHPFDFIDEYVEEVWEAERLRMQLSSIDRVTIEGEPYLKSLGGGHYEISVPEEARLVMVYNLGGAMVSRNTYADTSLVNVDLSAQPAGFYIITVIGESGTPYGFKIYR